MQTNYNAKYWKSKAVNRNAEIKALKKRIKEITQGRENWKSKYKEKTILSKKYKKEISDIKKKLKKIL